MGFIILPHAAPASRATDDKISAPAAPKLFSFFICPTKTIYYV